MFPISSRDSVEQTAVAFDKVGRKNIGKIIIDIKAYTGLIMSKALVSRSRRIVTPRFKSVPETVVFP